MLDFKETPTIDQDPPIIKTEDDIHVHISDLLKGLRRFPSGDYHYHVAKSVPPKCTPGHPVPVHQQELFQVELSMKQQPGLAVLLSLNQRNNVKQNYGSALTLVVIL